jgi:hypothetical protein
MSAAKFTHRSSCTATVMPAQYRYLPREQLEMLSGETVGCGIPHVAPVLGKCCYEQTDWRRLVQAKPPGIVVTHGADLPPGTVDGQTRRKG